MGETSKILALPYISPGQAQKHVTHNEALRRLDILVQLAVSDDTQAAPPPSPAEGARFIIAAGGSGDWTGQDGKLAVFDNGTWQFLTPAAGWQCFVIARHAMVVHDGTDWTAPSTVDFSDIPALGIGTVASGANPLSARLNSALWTARYAADGGDGSLVHRINKEGPTDDAGFVFQTGFETRSLFGLFGSEQFRLTISPNGQDFRDGLIIDPASAIVDQPHLPRFKAITNYDNVLVADTWTKIAINQAEYNDQAAFDPATNSFAAPVGGSYLLGASLTFAEGPHPDAQMSARLVVNGASEIAGTRAHASGPNIDRETSLQIQSIAQLGAGDTVELQAKMKAHPGNVAAQQTAFWGLKIG